MILIFLGDRNHEAEVRAHELVERFLIFETNPLRQRNFFFAGDERLDADVAKVLIERTFVVRRFSIDRNRHTGCCSFLTTAGFILHIGRNGLPGAAATGSSLQNVSNEHA